MKDRSDDPSQNERTLLPRGYISLIPKHEIKDRPLGFRSIYAYGKHYATGKEGRKEMFYLTTHSTHFIYGYMASDIWLRTILMVRKETCCRHIGYSYRLTARVLLYAPSHRQNNTYHGLCYTSRRIDPMTHRKMSERSYHGATSCSSLSMKSKIGHWVSEAP